ncbi:CheR family methyltransferase [Paenibacillus koleovorans]|uniref:CheR family methyltransferase n=1 Tax=Paenibacillus koleovorans TaxID=121608 RepID=UPI000FDCBE20|nr:protein-glutamate O-methyltransferase CheR [Paenibacillus koleovorans]
MEDREFLTFIKRVKDYSGIDLAQYKEAQMKRRLITLYTKRGFAGFTAFYDAMMKDRELYYEFLDRMTINVSEFWRNPNRWEVLEKKFITEMARTGGRVKCWSAACSTGEEPYTLAMILAENGLLEQSQIIATDIDDGAMDKAKTGVYPDRSIRDVPDRLLKKYFTQQDAHFRIVDSLKKHVIYKKQNLLNDMFDVGFDLIICRNVMIYFTEDAKHNLYHKFSRSLKPGGLLFVGSTEQIFTPGQYELEPAETFFYRKKR